MAGRRELTDPAFVRAAGNKPPLATVVPDRARVSATGIVASYALAAILVYFGALKVTATQAQLIEPLVAGSPLLSWLYDRLGAADVARLMGGVEIVAALLFVTTPVSPGLCLAGSILAMAIFGTTLSFLVTTPGSFVHLPDFPIPAPTPMTAFILKDVFLLLAAVLSCREAVRAMRRRG